MKPTRQTFSAANPLDPRLLLRIWRQLDKNGREQVITAAFGMLKAQTSEQTDGPAGGSRLPKAMRNVLFRSGARAPFDKVMLCGPNKALDFGRDLHARVVGRRRLPMRWLENGNLIAPDWRVVRRPEESPEPGAAA
jgi:hypothetical protein